LTVIEADAVSVHPLLVDSLNIFPGQRYSVVVTANQPIGNYWFRADSIPQVYGWTPQNDYGINKAIFRYLGAPILEPTTSAGPYKFPLNESFLRPFDNVKPPGGVKPDIDITLPVGLNAQEFRWTLGNGSWFPPTIPVLLQILARVVAPQDVLLPQNVITLPFNKIIDVTVTDAFNGGIQNNHVFHLHGHTFYVLQSTGQLTPNYIDPPQRDVLAIYDAGTIKIRFVTNNPGPWIFHCHIDWHLSQGLAVVFAEAPEQIRSGNLSAIVPEEWYDLCNDYYNAPLSDQLPMGPYPPEWLQRGVIQSAPKGLDAD